MNMFFLGDKLSHKLKQLKYDGEFLSPMEIVEETQMVLTDSSGQIKLKEILMPSMDDRPEEEFIDQNGILVPTKATLFHSWPQPCGENDLEITFFTNIIGKRREFWGRIGKLENQPVVFFEAVRDDLLPWTDINVLPERFLDSDVYAEITKNVAENLPNAMAYSVPRVRHDIPIAYYTVKLKGTAYTVIDVGCAFRLSQYLFNIFGSILNDNLYMLFSMATKQLEMIRNTNLAEMIPNHDLCED